MALMAKDLKKYGDLVLGAGATTVKVIAPRRVVTAPWVRWKCQFGCGGFGHSYCCPPHTPTDQETRRVLDGYHRALLCHLQTTPAPDRKRRLRRFRETLIDLEGELFKDGYYKAFAFLAGPCWHCGECSVERGEACANRHLARPSLEGCGIDVYRTARNHRLPIVPLRTEAEPRNTYGLVLVD